jgi:DNA-binding response OmpR family regulator
MPRLDGFALTEKLRNNAAYKNTPIIIMTSREKEEDKRRGIQVGADAYIIKGSFDQTNLLETVHNLVG